MQNNNLADANKLLFECIDYFENSFSIIQEYQNKRLC